MRLLASMSLLHMNKTTKLSLLYINKATKSILAFHMLQQLHKPMEKYLRKISSNCHQARDRMEGMLFLEVHVKHCTTICPTPIYTKHLILSHR